MDIASFLIGLQAGQNKAGGSGGGSLPAGVYLYQPEWNVPSGYRYKVFKYAGELYALGGNVTTSGYANYVYKLDSTTNKWSTLITSSGSYGLGSAYIDATGWRGVEYNGKFHFFSGKYHAIFDGTTFTASTSISSGNITSCAVYNGKLYVFEYDYYYLYEWDDTNSAWTSLGILSQKPSHMYAFNDELYFASSSTLYRYVDGTLEPYMTLTSNPTANVFSVNNTMYYTYGWGKKTIYRVNLSTKEEVVVGTYNGFLQEFYSVNTNDISFAGITNNTTASRVPFFVVNIVEATE